MCDLLARNLVIFFSGWLLFREPGKRRRIPDACYGFLLSFAALAAVASPRLIRPPVRPREAPLFCLSAFASLLLPDFCFSPGGSGPGAAMLTNRFSWKNQRPVRGGRPRDGGEGNEENRCDSPNDESSEKNPKPKNVGWKSRWWAIDSHLPRSTNALPRPRPGSNIHQR